MIFVKSFLAGVAALMMAVFLIYGLAAGVPRILELIPVPLGEGGIRWYGIGPFPMWPLLVAAFFIFGSGFYWSFRRAGHRR